MWKESYGIGVEIIDSQHKQLFEMVENLMRIVNKQQEEVKSESIKAVAFLKDYVVRHFADEEEYQLSLNYEGYEKHKRIHEGFIETVLDFERRMVETDFSLGVVKQFAGMLATWLIYHVAREDRKYVSLIKDKQLSEAGTYQESFEESMKNVFTTLTGVSINDVTDGLPDMEEKFYVNIGITGSSEGEVMFAFPKETAFSIIHAMTLMEVVTVDDIVVSALCEIANIVSGNAASVLAAGGIQCDITTPKFVEEQQQVESNQSIRFSTDLGDVGVTIKLS